MRVLRFSGRVSGELRYFSKSDSAGVKRQDSPPPPPHYDLFPKPPDASSKGWRFSFGAKVMGFRA